MIHNGAFEEIYTILVVVTTWHWPHISEEKNKTKKRAPLS